MRSIFCILFAVVLVTSSGCGGNSPYEKGKALAKSVISSIESGDPTAMQSAMADAQEKAGKMNPGDAQQFMEGYNSIALPYMRSKMGN